MPNIPNAADARQTSWQFTNEQIEHAELLKKLRETKPVPLPNFAAETPRVDDRDRRTIEHALDEFEAVSGLWMNKANQQALASAVTRLRPLANRLPHGLVRDAVAGVVTCAEHVSLNAHRNAWAYLKAIARRLDANGGLEPLIGRQGRDGGR